jgi:thiol-disulfide isomerase/thioredoxin
MRRWLTGLLAIVVVAAGGCRDETDRNGHRPSTGPRSDSGGRLDAPYPIEPFTGVDLEGRPISLAAWKGNVVIVNVWATWCAPCRREMPALAALQEKYRESVRVLGLLQDNVTTDFAREFVRSVRVTYPIVRSTFDLERRFPQVLALPMTFVIDPQGRLVAVYAGEIEPAELERQILSVIGR